MIGACSSAPSQDPGPKLSTRDFVEAGAPAQSGGKVPIRASSPDFGGPLAPKSAGVDRSPHGSTDPDSKSSSGPLAVRSAVGSTIPTITVEQARDGLEVTSHAGAPDRVAEEPAPVGAPVVVEAVVGSISGKPVRASEFFEPVGSRLAALAGERGMTRERWLGETRRAIADRLRTMITDELLLGEGKAALTPEQRENLVAFAQQMREKLESLHGGSREKAEQAVRASSGQEFEDFINQQMDVAVIYVALDRYIKSRVHITKRDIEIFYAQNRARFNPPPTYTFRRISVPTAREEGVREIARHLQEGEPFAAVAVLEPNTYKRSEGGLIVREGVRAEPDAAPTAQSPEPEFFKTPVLNDAARSLAPGAWVGPIVVGRDTEWLFLEKVEDRARTLYQAQTEIERQLRSSREEEEKARFLRRMLDKGSFTNIDEMAGKLLAIAERSYLDPTLPPLPASTPVARE